MEVGTTSLRETSSEFRDIMSHEQLFTERIRRAFGARSILDADVDV